MISSKLSDEMDSVTFSIGAFNAVVSAVSTRLLSGMTECYEYGRILRGEVYRAGQESVPENQNFADAVEQISALLAARRRKNAAHGASRG
jgi:hypothetical protein